jgi:hypothetical protein
MSTTPVIDTASLLAAVTASRRETARLEAAQKDLETRQRAARKAAELKAANDLLDKQAPELAQSRDAAQSAWAEAAADPAVGIAGLFDAWVTLRCASAARAALIGQAGSKLDGLEPLRHETSGQPIQHRADTQDYMAQSTFVAALEEAITARANRAAVHAGSGVQRALSDAATTALNAVK